MNQSDNILIIGAGLCGSLLALRLAQRGHKVMVYESRPDMRKTQVDAGRSINLALSDRGLRALRLVGVEKLTKEICIPMKGRLIHDEKGNTFESNYSGREGECINSISRGDLNQILLEEADKNKSVTLNFNCKCIHVNHENSSATFLNAGNKEEFTIKTDVIFGTDGAGSVLRKSFEQLANFDFIISQDFLTHGYKELEIPVDAFGKHQISKDHLHIWPRGNYMLIALPNTDGSFTVTLFLSYNEGEYNFNNLVTKEKITSFFKQQFPDALELIPDVLAEFENNPTGKLGTVKCYPWSYKNSLLLGDAAHAVVPFYGQGMNASFEDVLVLDEVINQNESENWQVVFEKFQKLRKPNADAIADLAIDNYYEMRDHVANEDFKLKRKVEMALEKTFPNQYFSKYSLVTFNEQIGYYEAMTRGRKQDELLLSMIQDKTIQEVDVENKNALKNILEKIEEKIHYVR